MKQRLGIAMAIVDAPSLLVLDEPMNGLDPLGMADLRAFLRDLPATRGTSVLVSSHLLHEIEQICDRVVFIRDGRLLPDLMLDRGRLDGMQVVWLRTGDDARAAGVLREASGVVEVAAQPTGLVCRLHERDVPRIATLLVAAQIPLLELTPREPRLEDVYRAHYGEGRTQVLG